MGYEIWTTTEEKEYIRILQLQKELPDWEDISKHLKKLNITKSAKKCYMKWHRNKKKESYKNVEFFQRKKKIRKLGYGSWTILEEDELLRILELQNENPDWKEISNLLKKVKIIKSSKQCYMRWHSNKKTEKYNKIKFKTVKTWSKNEEKELLRLLHSQNGHPNWNNISKLLKEFKIYKTTAQCYAKWHRNKKKKDSYICKFDTRKKKRNFSTEEEKKLLKMIFDIGPKWQKIANYFDNGLHRNIPHQHYLYIMRANLRKACKLCNIKGDFFRKIKPRLFTSLIHKEIKIDLREFKKYDFGKKDKNCPDFIFLNFFEFINEIYFNDYQDIRLKITEKEIFVLKQFIVYLIKMNFNFTKDYVRKRTNMINYKEFYDCLLKFQNDVINTFDKSKSSFDDWNGMLIEKIDENKMLIEIIVDEKMKNNKFEGFKSFSEIKKKRRFKNKKI